MVVSYKLFEAMDVKKTAMPGFPETVRDRQPCRGGCCGARVPSAEFEEFKRRVQKALRFHLEDSTLMLQFTASGLDAASGLDDSVYALFVNPQFLNNDDYEATVLLMSPVADNADVLEFVHGAKYHGVISWFSVQTEDDLFYDLLAKSTILST